MGNKEYMTSRQRVIASVEHRQPDRMPIDLGMHFSTGISIFAYKNLKDYLGFPCEKVEPLDMMCLLARVENDVLERFHIDTIMLNPPFPKTTTWEPRPGYVFTVPDQFTPTRTETGDFWLDLGGCKMHMPAGGFFFDNYGENFWTLPVSEKLDFLARMEAGEPVEGLGVDFYGMPLEEKLDYFAKRAERIYKETDKYTMYMGFNAFFDGLDFACDMLTDPEACITYNEKRLKDQIAHFDLMNQKMGKFVNCIEVNADLGTQNDLICTPDSYEEICYPFLKKFCEHVHNTSDLHIFMHSCGACSKLLPLIIDAGVDIINPVQISARGMDSKWLKKEFGDKICFWGGGCDTQRVLNLGTPEEVRAHTKEQVKIFKPNGGFVFNQVHNIMGDIRPENIVSMLDTAYENSFYD